MVNLFVLILCWAVFLNTLMIAVDVIRFDWHYRLVLLALKKALADEDEVSDE